MTSDLGWKIAALGYALVYPAAMIGKILLAQLLVILG